MVIFMLGVELELDVLFANVTSLMLCTMLSTFIESILWGTCTPFRCSECSFYSFCLPGPAGSDTGNIRSNLCSFPTSKNNLESDGGLACMMTGRVLEIIP